MQIQVTLALRFFSLVNSAFFFTSAVQQKHGPNDLGWSLHHSPGHLAVGGKQNCPDGLRLEQGGEVGVGHLWLWKVPAGLGS